MEIIPPSADVPVLEMSQSPDGRLRRHDDGIGLTSRGRRSRCYCWPLRINRTVQFLILESRGAARVFTGVDPTFGERLIRRFRAVTRFPPHFLAQPRSPASGCIFPGHLCLGAKVSTVNNSRGARTPSSNGGQRSPSKKTKRRTVNKAGTKLGRINKIELSENDGWDTPSPAGFPSQVIVRGMQSS